MAMASFTPFSPFAGPGAKEQSAQLPFHRAWAKTELAGNFFVAAARARAD
jgi:hypothetical protein